ncbi:MAG TPA: DinB family protein [Thermomicrobiales bacterium]|nr:DinB family protein [Thermomicrobiales bacterium]
MNIWANLYRHHWWSNLTLIDFLASLTDEQLAYTAPGVYGDPLSTIRHIVSSDADYVRIIPDAPDVPQIAQEGPFGGWEEVRSVAEAADTALISYVDGLTEDASFVDIDDGEAFELTRSFLLAQIIHHATEHRSQIRSVLSSHGVEAPEISVWAWRLSDEGQELLRRLKPVTQ